MNVEKEFAGEELKIRDQSGNRTLVVFGAGDEVEVTSGEMGVRFLLISGAPLREPVAWHGPIVMNSRAELHEAFRAQCRHLRQNGCRGVGQQAWKLSQPRPADEGKETGCPTDRIFPMAATGLPAARFRPDGTASLGEEYRVPPRCGVAVRVGAGDLLRVINTHGTQVCDFWAFNADNPYEYLSMSHCHTELESVMPQTGDTLVSNRRQPIVNDPRG